MTSWRRLLGVMLLAGLLTAALPVGAQGGVQVVTNANLSLRASASSTSARLGTVPYQTEMTATAISPDRNWVAVVYNGQGGWLSLTYTGVLSGSLGSLNESTQTFTTGGSGAVTSSVMVTPTINLRYRTDPDLDVRPSGAIPYNEPVPALGVSQDELFVLVNYLGQNVWVYREYVVTVTGSLDSFTPGAAPVGGSAAALPEDTGFTPVEASIMAELNFERDVPDSGVLLDPFDCEALDLPSFEPMNAAALPANQPILIWVLFAAPNFDAVVDYRSSVRRQASVDGQLLSPQYVLEAVDLTFDLGSGDVFGSTELYYWLYENPTPGPHLVLFTEEYTRPLVPGLDYDGDGAPDVLQGNYVSSCVFGVAG